MKRVWISTAHGANVVISEADARALYGLVIPARAKIGQLLRRNNDGDCFYVAHGNTKTTHVVVAGEDDELYLESAEW